MCDDNKMIVVLMVMVVVEDIINLNVDELTNLLGVMIEATNLVVITTSNSDSKYSLKVM